MICTITSSTLTAATSVGTVHYYAAATVGLLTLLAIKEFASSSKVQRLELLSRHLNIAIIPLLVVFSFTLLIALE